MKHVEFDDAERYAPEEGWQRVSLAGSDAATTEWFEKRPGHSSPMHDHENEQICMVLEGELTVYTEEHDDGVVLEQFDSVLFESWEPHRVANEGDEMTVGLDIFMPGRSFDFWLDRLE